jgi:tryptophan synthase alpha chain
VSERIARAFGPSGARARKTLIPFITAGDPHPDWTVDIMHALVDGGANLIELGVPFSDPMADGPVIQEASERAISKGVTLAGVLDMVRAFRADDTETPVVLMGYMNPVERFGADALADAAASAGVDGLLLVDCPPEEGQGLASALQAAGIASIRLVAPTTRAQRLERICAAASGFIYYVSFKGITGANRLDAQALAGPINDIRARTDLPVAAGFGINDPQSASAVAEFADGVVIGSALVKTLATCDSREQATGQARSFVASVRQALDNSHSA